MLERPAGADKTSATQPDSQPTSQPSTTMLKPVHDRNGKECAGISIKDEKGTRHLCGIKCENVSIKKKETTIQVCGIYSEEGFVPSFKVAGPSRLKARIYPTIKKKRFEIELEPETITNYSLVNKDGIRQIRTGKHKTKISEFTFGDMDDELTIGAPVELLINTKAGKNIFAVYAPTGFIEIVGLEPLKEAVPEPKPPKPKPRIVKKVPKPAPKKEEHAHFAGFELEAGSTFLHEIGPNRNSGDISRLLALASIGHTRLPKGLELNVGILGSSYSLRQELELAETNLRSISANAVFGLAFSRGDHHAFARAFGGYMLMRRNISSEIYDKSETELSHTYEAGGQAGYSYGHWISAEFSGSSNPFNPFTLRVDGRIPKWWGSKIYPTLELNAFWLHSLRPIEEVGRVGGIDLNIKNLFVHLSGKGPIWKWNLPKDWLITPSLLLAGDLNASEEGFHHADFQAGVSALLEHNRLLLELGGAISPLTKTPYFLLMMRYE